jgi:hypothetical protein
LATASREQLLECIERQNDDHEMRRMKVNRLVAQLRANNHHLARLVNDADEPADWEAARKQVLETRDFLNGLAK